MSRWATIDSAKIEAEIAKLDAKLDGAGRGEKFRSWQEAFDLCHTSATRDALVVILNSLTREP